MKRFTNVLGVGLILVFNYAVAYIWARNYLSITVETSATIQEMGKYNWSLQSIEWPPSQDHFINDVFAPVIFAEEILFNRKVKFGVVRWTWSPTR